MKILLSALVLVVMISCKSASEHRQERLLQCNNVCKDYPDIKEMSREEGGGLIFFGGYQKDTCSCSRTGSKG